MISLFDCRLSELSPRLCGDRVPRLLMDAAGSANRRRGHYGVGIKDERPRYFRNSGTRPRTGNFRNEFWAGRRPVAYESSSNGARRAIIVSIPRFIGQAWSPGVRPFEVEQRFFAPGCHGLMQVNAEHRIRNSGGQLFSQGSNGAREF